MIPNKEAYYPLFIECVEALNATILSPEEDMLLTDLFEKHFPITKWGKIDWEKIDHKIEIGYDPEDIVSSLERLLGKKVDTTVYILWSSAGSPGIKTDLNKIAEFFDAVISVAPEKFIFNLELGYILEILVSDKMMIGTVPECARI
ncbi:MAG: hypothetical protein IT346_02540 [Epsilonproteobacteria bacterium]|nr:hypothetical protein [Campylobacterota bacterium]